MSDPVIVWNEQAFNHVFRSWDGPVGRDLREKCRVIEAKAMVHVGFDTGQLLFAIDTAFDHFAGDLLARVGANPNGNQKGYALYHHEGTAPHRIVARNAKALRFPDRRQGGGVVYRHSVSHPGNKPNPYLTQPLREVITP